MLDFVFTVDDPVTWHAKNMKKNWSHYSFLKALGPRVVSSIQNNYGAGVYYNPLITCDGRVSAGLCTGRRQGHWCLCVFSLGAIDAGTAALSSPALCLQGGVCFSVLIYFSCCFCFA